jgi:hypothetical protein
MEGHLENEKFWDVDLGNGVKTNGHLTIPAIGKGPFPGVIF